MDGLTRGRPKDEAARQRVLEVVDDLVEEHGYANVSLQLVADAADVSRQSLYRWWGSKAELVLEACITDLDQLLDRRFDDVGDMVVGVNRFLNDNPAGRVYSALLAQSIADPTIALLLRSDPLERRLSRAASKIIGTDHTRDPDSTALILFGPVLAAALLRAPRLTDDQIRRHVARTIIDF